MQKLEMDYHYQAKMDATATFTITDEWLKKEVYEPLDKGEVPVVKCEIKIYDKEDHHLTTGRIYWQVKPWSRVKTKV